MSDDDLTSYYQGINDRISEIAREAETVRQDVDLNPEEDVLVASQPFVAGRNGQTLLKRREVVSQEMRRRGLSP